MTDDDLINKENERVAALNFPEFSANKEQLENVQWAGEALH